MKTNQIEQEIWNNAGEDIIAEDIPCIQITTGDIGSKEFYHIADVASQYNEDKNIFEITDKDRKNAALIVCAPELLKSLIRLMKEYKGIVEAEYNWTQQDEDDEEWVYLKDLVKRAKGEGQ